MKTTLEEEFKASVNVLQVFKPRTIEHPNYFSKISGIKASISSSVELGFNSFNSISVNSPESTYPFVLVVC